MEANVGLITLYHHITLIDCTLEATILNFIDKISTDLKLLARLLRSVADHVNDCIPAEGGHFEHRVKSKRYVLLLLWRIIANQDQNAGIMLSIVY